ncbi:hypothetical protein BJ912DRAFT_936039 [Pholiota molesta]|nr:hypothetical protein BJ912DRAFT_936039 [Pholiota molesta]
MRDGHKIVDGNDSLRGVAEERRCQGYMRSAMEVKSYPLENIECVGSAWKRGVNARLRDSKKEGFGRTKGTNRAPHARASMHSPHPQAGSYPRRPFAAPTAPAPRHRGAPVHVQSKCVAVEASASTPKEWWRYERTAGLYMGIEEALAGAQSVEGEETRPRVTDLLNLKQLPFGVGTRLLLACVVSLRAAATTFSTMSSVGTERTEDDVERRK